MALRNSLKIDSQACFQFKASFSPCTIFHILRYDLDDLDQQLAEITLKMPSFFQSAPIVIDLEKIHAAGILDFAKLKQILLANNLVPMGVRGGTSEQHAAALESGLPFINIGKSVVLPVEKPEPQYLNTTLLITHPIRSGMQVYAKEGDLIVMGSVSSGAEIMADGHIHVYGPLRGRALAGAKGNRDARIFCHRLEAELVSIAGYYMTKEEMQTLSKDNDIIQVYLENEQIRIEAV